MTVLPPDLRKDLENACVRGRRAAEEASRTAINSLGVIEDRPPAHLTVEDRDLRRALRAKRQQLGDGPGRIDLLVADCAYEQWHRLLFARFLAENNLLIHPEFGAPVTLGECGELAADLGEPDAWAVASRYAAEILPGIFRLNDPCFKLRLAPEGRLALEHIVEAVAADTFSADDALGWVYQHWQKERKDEVNVSERKIGGADLAPVTQLFTENYMVRFLLENSLGAWWASRHPESPLLRQWTFLRFDADGHPAAGPFEGWPSSASEVTFMDPCCGSGHFLVEAFSMLWQMRAEEAGLDPLPAQDAVLRENLFGLELDSRCVQIAMFALALAAWRAGGGWRELPVPNVACSGIPVKAPLQEWLALAGADQRLRNALETLHALFRDADTLGSLIDPGRPIALRGSSWGQHSLDEVDWAELGPRLEAALGREEPDPATAVLGSDAAAGARAATYLARQYTLIATNVPYLTRRRQSERLRDYCADTFAQGKDDLATAFLLRLRRLTSRNGAYQLVMPQAWTNLASYRALRHELLSEQAVSYVIKLGAGAFRAISGEVVNVVLVSIHAAPPSQTHEMMVADLGGAEDVAADLAVTPMRKALQADQRRNPDSIVTYDALAGHPLLQEFANGLVGMMTGDSPRFIRYFWEVPALGSRWAFQQSTSDGRSAFGGRQNIMLWDGGHGVYREYVESTNGKLGGAPFRGRAAWNKRGVSISQMAPFPCSIYTGELFDNNAAVLLPHREELLAPIWHFAVSGKLEAQLRTFNSSMKVEASTLVKVPFDLEHWQRVAEAAGPLPEPHSGDPTQWLFTGRPEAATESLQVGVGRLLRYRWPEEPADDLDALADTDGIVCLPSVLGERTAADRLQEVLALAFGGTWSPARATELLAAAGSKKGDLDSWLRDEFFKAHCQLFGNRPFIWHIWDGRSDGFSALANYHRLDRPTLERLTYTYLGDWIERQAASAREEVVGAEERLIAARDLQRKLELILAGEPPYDIYVRWKPAGRQAVGWAPDLDDGVRLNVRPFVEAGVLRAKFNVKWAKDRGTNPDGSERRNDVHLTNAQKQDSRDAGGAA